MIQQEYMIASAQIAASSAQIGATYSTKYATILGLDWRSVYLELLHDLNIQYVRLPVYWDQIEKEPGVFDWADIDWQLEQAAKTNTKVLIALGYRVPRWPECYAPGWAKTQRADQFKQSLFAMLSAVVGHCGAHVAVEAWQVENEPFAVKHGHGIECRDLTHLLAEEVEFVRSCDPCARPIVVTYPHLPRLLPWWNATLVYGDIAGIDIYTKLWLDFRLYKGYIKPLQFAPYLLPSLRQHRVLASQAGKQLWVMELQAEPWGPRLASELSQDEAFASISPDMLIENIQYVLKSGISRMYLWGIEWWMYQRETQANTAMWEIGKSIFHRTT
jgi:hypothetical protein